MVKKRKYEIFTLEIRRKIFHYIKNNPGLHLRELARRLEIPKTTFDYHLRYLEKQEMILKKQDRKFYRYYATKNVDNKYKTVIGLLREKILRRIILFLFLYPEHTRFDIANDLGNSPSTISHHLKKLIDNDIVEKDSSGHKYIYRIKNQSELYNLLILYENSLSEDIIVTYLLDWVKYTIPDGFPTSYKKRKRKDIEEIYQNLLEIFSHPYHI